MCRFNKRYQFERQNEGFVLHTRQSYLHKYQTCPEKKREQGGLKSVNHSCMTFVSKDLHEDIYNSIKHSFPSSHLIQVQRVKQAGTVKSKERIVSQRRREKGNKYSKVKSL